MPQNENANASNPFEEICVLVSELSSVLAFGNLAKAHGFSVYLYNNIQKLSDHIKSRPLTAGIFVQSGQPNIETKLRAVYKGPIQVLPLNKEEALEIFSHAVRQLYRNQLKIQDAAALRTLRTLNSFLNRTATVVFATGSSSALDLALDYLNLFADKPGVMVKPTLEPGLLPAGTWLYTRDLFSMSAAEQRNWAMKYAEVDFPHIILESNTLAELDVKYDSGALDEVLYEKLSLLARDLSPLEKYTFEELAVQPPELGEPKIVLATDEVAQPVVASLPPQQTEDKKAGLAGIFKGIFKR